MINQEPLKEIGLIIKKAREEQGLSQEELAYKSRVSLAHLKNIEETNREELPEEAYLLGFITKILRALNFDNPQSIIENYKREEGSYIVQSIVNSHAVSESKLGFGFADFKIYHLYTIFIICLVVLAWLTISNYSKNNINLDQVKLNSTEADVPVSTESSNIISIDINGIDLEANPSLLDNTPTATKPIFTAGVGSKSLAIEAVSNAWYQVIGVAQQKILYEGDVGPSSNVDHFRFYDDQGFVLATGDAGAFMVDTGNEPFKLGKPHETIKWYYPQTARRIYKAWDETTKVTKLDPVAQENQAPNMISNTDLMNASTFEEHNKPLELTTERPVSNLQEQPLLVNPVVKKPLSTEPVNGEPMSPIVIKEAPVAPRAPQISRPAPSIQQDTKAKDKKEDSKKKKDKDKNKKKNKDKKENTKE